MIREKYLLDQLYEAGDKGLRWVCRRSSSGTGRIRLHQVTTDQMDINDCHILSRQMTWPTPAEAISDFLEHHKDA